MNGLTIVDLARRATYPADLPLPCLTTERLILRPLSPCDVPALHKLITDAITRFWIGWETPQSEADVEIWVKDLLRKTGDRRHLSLIAVERNDRSGRPIGCVSLDGLADPFYGAWFELDFWLGEPWWGRGYASEMARAMLDWALLDAGLGRVTVSWTDGNVGSHRVIQKLVPGQEPLVLPAEKHGQPVRVFHYQIPGPNETQKRCFTFCGETCDCGAAESMAHILSVG